MINDLSTLHGYLLTYSRNSHVTVDHSSVDLETLFGQNGTLPLPTTIKIELVLDNHYQVQSLIKDLEVSVSMKREQKLRESNPALQHAWEEYQLLLKLIK